VCVLEERGDLEQIGSYRCDAVVEHDPVGGAA
jgi:hypothetical protein